MSNDDILYFVDSTSSITFDKALQLSREGKFLPAEKLSFGKRPETYWSKIIVDNQLKHNQVLFVPQIFVGELSVFYKKDSLWEEDRRSFPEFYLQNPIIARKFVFHIPFQSKGQQEVFIKAQSNRRPISLDGKLYKLRQYYNESILVEIGFGLLFGVIAALLLYNLFIYIDLKDTTYLYYSFAIAANLLLQIHITGHYFYFLPDVLANWYSYYGNLFLQ